MESAAPTINFLSSFPASARSWTWQTCTEFGYFQTTGGGPKGIFGAGTPLTLVYFNVKTSTIH